MTPPRFTSIEKDGWVLESGENRHARSPESFEIPSRVERESLHPGDAVKLLFDIETREEGRIIDRGVDRMWVIVKRTTGNLYIGVLDNDPGLAEGLTLRPGMEILFGPEHVIAIERPPGGLRPRKIWSRILRGVIGRNTVKTGSTQSTGAAKGARQPDVRGHSGPAACVRVDADPT